MIQVGYKINKDLCCEACVFGGMKHADWCRAELSTFLGCEIKVDPSIDEGTLIWQDKSTGQELGRIINIGKPKPELHFPQVLDSTMLSSFRACPQQFWLSYVRKLIPAQKNPHFTAGGAFAKALEVARQVFWTPAWEKLYSIQERQELATHSGLIQLIKTYGDYEPVEKQRHKTWDRVAAAFVSYMDRYPLGSDHLQVAEWQGQRMVEFSFALELPIKHPESGDPIMYGGRPDWIASYENQLYVVDEKTTKYFTQTWASKWPLRAQLLGYAYACKAYGIPVNGVAVRGTAMKLTEIDHSECIMAIPQFRLNRWYEQALHTVSDMVASWNANYFRFDFGDACVAYSGCEFQELCKVQNIEPWLTPEAGLFQENTWNPLAKGDEDE